MTKLNELNNQTHVFSSEVKQYNGFLRGDKHSKVTLPIKAITFIYIEWNAKSHNDAIETIKKVIPPVGKVSKESSR